MKDSHRAAARPRSGVAARGGPTAWRSVDLVTLAVLGVALGVAFWGFDTVIYPGLTALSSGFPPAGELMLGVWLLPAVLGALIVRRPGAALFIELVAASLEALLGNKWGGAVMVSAVLQGLGVEIVAAAWRYRRWRPDVAVAAGALSAACAIVLYEWWSYVPDYSPGWKAVYLMCGVLSGAVVAGLGAWALMQALAATGALTAFPPGEERLTAGSHEDEAEARGAQHGAPQAHRETRADGGAADLAH